MKEHLNDLKAGGRPMTREELAQENKLLKEENKKLKTILSKVRKDDDLTIDEKITLEELER